MDLHRPDLDLTRPGGLGSDSGNILHSADPVVSREYARRTRARRDEQVDSGARLRERTTSLRLDPLSLLVITIRTGHTYSFP